MASEREVENGRGLGRRTLSQPHVRLSLEFALLLLGAELTRTLPLPWRAAGVLFAAAALVQGVRALRAGRRARLADPGGSPPVGFGPVLLGVGVMLAGLLLVWHVVLLVLSPVVSDQQRCTERALTRTAQLSCEQQLQDRINGLVDQRG